MAEYTPKIQKKSSSRTRSTQAFFSRNIGNSFFPRPKVTRVPFFNHQTEKGKSSSEGKDGLLPRVGVSISPTQIQKSGNPTSVSSGQGNPISLPTKKNESDKKKKRTKRKKRKLRRISDRGLDQIISPLVWKKMLNGLSTGEEETLKYAIEERERRQVKRRTRPIVKPKTVRGAIALLEEAKREDLIYDSPNRKRVKALVSAVWDWLEPITRDAKLQKHFGRLPFFDHARIFPGKARGEIRLMLMKLELGGTIGGYWDYNISIIRAASEYLEVLNKENSLESSSIAETHEALKRGAKITVGGAVGILTAPIAVNLAITEGSLLFFASKQAGRSIWVWAGTNPVMATAVSEFAAATGLEIIDAGGFRDFFKQLQTPEGAFWKLVDVLILQQSRGGGKKIRHTGANTGSEIPLTTNKPKEASLEKPKRSTTDLTKVKSDTAKTKATEKFEASQKQKLSGQALAHKMGYKPAEPGYYWANYGGKLIYKKNPNNPGKQRVYDPKDRVFYDKQESITSPQIAQEAGRLQEKVITSITSWPKNERSHATSSFGNRKPDFLVKSDPKTGKWVVADKPESAHFVADSKYYDESTIRLTDQIRGFIEIAGKTNPPSGKRFLILMTNKTAKISDEIFREASKIGVKVVQIVQHRSK